MDYLDTYGTYSMQVRTYMYVCIYIQSYAQVVPQLVWTARPNWSMRLIAEVGSSRPDYVRRSQQEMRIQQNALTQTITSATTEQFHTLYA